MDARDETADAGLWTPAEPDVIPGRWYDRDGAELVPVREPAPSPRPLPRARFARPCRSPA